MSSLSFIVEGGVMLMELLEPDKLISKKSSPWMFSFSFMKCNSQKLTSPHSSLVVQWLNSSTAEKTLLRT